MNDRDDRPAGPHGFRQPPNRLYEQVCEAVKAAGGVDASNIDVEIRPEGEEVVLHGSVPDPDQRRLAEECVLSVPGVRSVHNELAVGGPAGSSARP